MDKLQVEGTACSEPRVPTWNRRDVGCGWPDPCGGHGLPSGSVRPALAPGHRSLPPKG